MRRRLIRYLLIPLLVITAAAVILLWTKNRDQANSIATAQDEKPVVYVQQGHGNVVNCVAWSSDGRHAISGGDDGVVKIWNVATGREEFTLNASSGGGVTAVALLPDQEHLLTAGVDSTVRIWDLRTFREIRRLRASSGVSSAAVSNSGDRVFCTTSDSIAWAWSIPSGREIRRFVSSRRGFMTGALSADGRRTMAQTRDSVLTLWDVETGRTVNEFHTAGGAVFCAVFDQSGTRVLSGNGMGEAMRRLNVYTVAPGLMADSASRHADWCSVEIWNANTGAKCAHIAGHKYAVMAIRALPDGMRVLTCGLDSAMKVWSIVDGRLLKEFPKHPCSIKAAAISPDGRYVLTGGWDATMRLWDIERGLMVREFAPQASAITHVAFSAEATTVSVELEDAIAMWSLQTGRREEVVFPGDRGKAWSFSPDLKAAFADSSTGNPKEWYLKFWSLDSRRVLSVSSLPVTGDLVAYGFSADDRYCVVQANDSIGGGGFRVSQKGDSIFRGLFYTGGCTYRRFDMTTGQLSGSFRDQDIGSGGNRSIELSADGHRGLMLRHIPDAIIYDFATNQKTVLHDTVTGGFDADSAGGGRIICSILSPDGRRTIISRSDGRLDFWDTQTQQITRTLQFEDVVTPLVRTPDERLLVGGIGHTRFENWWEGNIRIPFRSWAGKTIGIFDAQTGRKIREFIGHAGAIKHVVSSRDGRTVASTSADGTMRLWNLDTGKEIVQFVNFKNGEWIAVTPEGYYTASLNGDAFLNVRAGTKITGIEPYRSTFYQPAVVEAALRLGDSEKAISEVLGCKNTCTTITDLPEMYPPVVVVKNPENGDTLLTQDTTLSFHVEDQRNTIQSVKVFVNGRPITGNPTRGVDEESLARGIQLDIPTDKKTLDLKVPLRLDEGDNLITITALGKSEAVDSLHVYVMMLETLPEQMEMDTVWILAVGVNKYQDKKLRSLNYCMNDAQGIIDAFKAQEGKTCRKVMSRLISDAGPVKPTYSDVVDNINYLHQAAEHDLVVLFLAGHGVNDRYGDFYFLPSDAEVTGAHEFRTSKAISGAQLQAAVEVSARRFVFVDACHSGDVGVDLVKLAREFKDNRVLIMTSSEGTRSSEEADSLKHGLFSYALIRGLQGEADITGSDGRVSAMELITYVSDKVNTMTEHRQNPVFWAPGGLSNFVVALAPHRTLALE